MLWREDLRVKSENFLAVLHCLKFVKLLNIIYAESCIFCNFFDCLLPSLQQSESCLPLILTYTLINTLTNTLINTLI